jgi:signal transduction histidine kinase
MSDRTDERLIPSDLHLRLLEQYAAPSVVVTDEHTVVHLTEGAARYFSVPAGAPSRDVTQLARAELRADLRAALHQAARQRTDVEVRRLPVVIEGSSIQVRICVRPVLKEGDPARGFFLILFEEEQERDVSIAAPVEFDGVIATELEDRVRDRTRELQSRLAEHAAAEEHVTSLLRKVVTAQEDERARIARDLHDQLGQQVIALRLALERHKERCTSNDLPDGDLPKALALASQIGSEVDFLAWELRPAILDDLGLAAALPRFVDEWSKHHRIVAEFHNAGFSGAELTPEGQVTFYRVAQEALNNIVKHAHASRVDVLLKRREGVVTLVVEDDGVGFDIGDPAVQALGIGLAGMRERAALIGGTLEIESSPGHGTTVFLRRTVAV